MDIGDHAQAKWASIMVFLPRKYGSLRFWSNYG